MNKETVIKELQEKLKNLKVGQEKELQKIRLEYLGKSGIINKIAKTIKDIEPSKRPQFGKSLNELKNKVNELLNKAEEEIKQKQAPQDISLDKKYFFKGSLHPTTHAIFQIEDILNKIGFVRKRYRETEDDWHPFEALNMPKEHPARDEWETFFIEGGLLTPHTSSGQIREMEKNSPPIKMLNIAKCYRRQASPKHSPMFYQFEGLYVDKNVSIAHLKGTLDYFIKGFLGLERKTRIRPYHFRFTEPSFEVDVTCNKCNGKGCKLCKAGWLEIGGAGMVHPQVLKNVGIDTSIYNGFAFGFGVERPYMMKGNINIPDIRLFYTPNLDFLNKF